MIKCKLRLLVFLLLFSSSLFATPLIPEIYIGAGLGYDTKESDGFTINNYNYLIGIRPLNLPVLGHLRLELQINDFVKKSTRESFVKSEYNTVLYYDLIRTIVDPYIGVGFNHRDYKNLPSNADVADENYSSFHLGAIAHASIFPFVPFDVYAEYKLSLESNANHLIMVGLKYSIIR